MKNVIFLVIIIVVGSCKSKNDAQDDVTNLLEIKTQQQQDKKMDIEALKKLTLEEAVKTYKQPLKDASFKYTDINITEFRIELKNVAKKYKLQDQIIKEATWEINQDALITVWYSKQNKSWSYVHAITYNKGDEF
ncbi:hypothetical protein [uncultured Algibacter sp.]|uniref:hypothetical protein n=1 Tax=uncultured Algibacter sp. TaxID=298659 RepID=UPI0032174E93